MEESIQTQTEPRPVKGYPIHSYKPVYPRQAAFIMAECKEKGLQVTFSSGKVRIFASTKLNEFQEIIKDSLNRYKPTPITRPVHAFYNNNKLVCICFKQNNTIYTYESNMMMMVAHQYIGTVPLAQHIKIFNTQEELNYTFNNLTALRKEGGYDQAHTG